MHKFAFQVQYGLESKRNEVIITGLQKVLQIYLICNFTSKYEELLASGVKHVDLSTNIMFRKSDICTHQAM